MDDVFYLTRMRGLPTVMWNPSKKCALAEFDRQGLFRTNDAEVARELEDMGYRIVTPDQILDAGLMLPEDFADIQGRRPGRGYTSNVEDRQVLGPPGPEAVDKLFDPRLVSASQGKQKVAGRSIVK